MNRDEHGTHASEPSHVGLSGSELTFSILAESRAPEVDVLLRAALSEVDARIQVGAIATMLTRRDRVGLTHALGCAHLLSSQGLNLLLEHSDDLLGLFRDLLDSSQAQTRANVVDMVCRRNQVKLAYLLVRALDDGEERIVEQALKGLEKLTRRYHQQVEAVRADRLDPPRHAGLSHRELESKRFALVDALLARLSPTCLSGRQVRTGVAENPVVLSRLLELAMGLDSRTDDLLHRILTSPHDPRSAQVKQVLLSSSSPQVLSFLVEMLRNPERSSHAVTVLERRTEPDFVRRLLQTERLFTDAGLREALHTLSRIPWLEAYDVSRHIPMTIGTPDPGIVEVLTESTNIIRAIHLVVLSRLLGIDILKGLAEHGPTELVRQSAGTTLDALVSGRSPREISIALLDTEKNLKAEFQRSHREKHVGVGARPSDRIGWAQPDAGLMPRDAFRQFFEEYDRLDPEVKELATVALKRLGPDLDVELREVLSSLDAQSRLKAVAIVSALNRERPLQDVLLELVSDPDERVRATVVKTLALLEDESAVRSLLRAVTDFDRRVVANSVEAIEATGFSQLVGLIRILARHPNNRIRANAVKALILVNSPEADSFLCEMLSSPVELMRLSATWVLGEVPDKSGRLEQLTHLAALDPSARVRQKARTVLGTGNPGGETDINS